MFDKGLVQDSFKFFDEKLLQMSDELQKAAESSSQDEVFRLHLYYAKLLIKAGFLVEASEHINDKVLAKGDDLPVIIQIKANYLAGKLCFFQNSYTASLDHY